MQHVACLLPACSRTPGGSWTGGFPDASSGVANLPPALTRQVRGAAAALRALHTPLRAVSCAARHRLRATLIARLLVALRLLAGGPIRDARAGANDAWHLLFTLRRKEGQEEDGFRYAATLFKTNSSKMQHCLQRRCPWKGRALAPLPTASPPLDATNIMPMNASPVALSGGSSLQPPLSI